MSSTRPTVYHPITDVIWRTIAKTNQMNCSAVSTFIFLLWLAGTRIIECRVQLTDMYEGYLTTKWPLSRIYYRNGQWYGNIQHPFHAFSHIYIHIQTFPIALEIGIGVGGIVSYCYGCGQELYATDFFFNCLYGRSFFQRNNSKDLIIHKHNLDSLLEKYGNSLIKIDVCMHYMHESVQVWIRLAISYWSEFSY